MRDYELTELKLAVALEEGTAGKGVLPASEKLRIEKLMPGVYVVFAPVAAHTLRLVIMADDFDLNMLGLPVGSGRGVLIIHARDIDAIAALGIEIDEQNFWRRDVLPGWGMLVVPFDDVAGFEAALRDVLPAYNAKTAPAQIPLDG